MGARSTKPKGRRKKERSYVRPLQTEGPFLRLEEAAALMCLSPWTVRHLVHKGEIKHIRIGKRIVFERQEIIRFMDDHSQRQSKGPWPSIREKSTPTVAT